MIPRLLAICFTWSILGLLPSTVHAQFKNTSFALDTGGWLITQPSPISSEGNVLAVNERPLRLGSGVKFGFESNLKLNQDQWWFSAKLNLGFLRPSLSIGSTKSDQYDIASRKALGTLMAAQASLGIRYYFATNYIRPYLQGGLSFLRLQTFKGDKKCSVEPGIICDPNHTNIENFLSHPNVGAMHIQPGLEIVFTKDIAFHFYTDFQHWLLFNAEDNNSIILGIGLLFYT